MFVKFWIFIVAVTVLGTASGKPWGDWGQHFGPTHNEYGPQHHRYGPPHHGPCGPHHNGRRGSHRGGSPPPNHHWYDSSESSDSDSSGEDDWGNWHYPCHPENDPHRWPPKPKPTPRPSPKPSPGPPPTPSPGPFPSPTPGPLPPPTKGPQPSPTPGPTPTPGPLPSPDLQQCLRSCPVTSEYNPVCGSDGITYTNMGRLECAKMCGVGVTFSRMAKCPAVTPGPPPPTLPPPSPSPREPELQRCLRSCPVTSEYNPVCGSDGVTYTNPGRLECAQMCGVGVALVRRSKCPENNGGGITPPAPTNPTPDLQACIRSCPVTSEYNPVCGSDGVTYSNMGRLECARMCGVAVTFSRASRCPAVQPTPTPIPTPSSERFRESEPTPTPTKAPTPTPSPTVGPTVTPGVDFTIDQDILDELFPTEGPDLSGLIDERHQDD